MTVRLGDWSMWVFKDDWEIIMVTYCSETNTSEQQQQQQQILLKIGK